MMIIIITIIPIASAGVVRIARRYGRLMCTAGAATADLGSETASLLSYRAAKLVCQRGTPSEMHSGLYVPDPLKGYYIEKE